MLVEVGDRTHVVLAAEGIPTLGGDDFDHVLAEMAVSEQDRENLSQAELFRLLDECRVKKEALHPNSRKITLDFDNIREGWDSISIPVSEYYERCRPLMKLTSLSVSSRPWNQASSRYWYGPPG